MKQPGLAASVVLALLLAMVHGSTLAQNSAPSKLPATQDFSGMYSFLKDGEFLQLSPQDDGKTTGFISRFGDSESDHGVFLDQFFKSASLVDNTLTFTTVVIHGTSFDFKGRIERGPGKNAGDEGYYVIKGTLTENTLDDREQKTASKSREVVLQSFPNDQQ